MTEKPDPAPEQPFPGSAGARFVQISNIIEHMNAPYATMGSFFDNAQSAAKGVVRATGKLDREEIRATLRSCLRPAGYEVAARHLRADHVVVLTGRHGLGKRTGALSLLDEVTREVLVELPPSVSLRALAEHPYKPGYGYLVCGHQDDGDAADQEFSWLTVRTQVREATAYLVVTVNREHGHRRSEHVQQVTWQAPEPADYLAQHLPEDAVAQIVEKLDGFRSMTDLARIAAHRDVDSALEELGALSVEPVRAWFAEPKPREAVLDLTALSFLSGVSERVFERWRVRLSDLLAEHMPENTEGQPQDAETALPRGRGRQVVADGLVNRTKDSSGRMVLDFAVATYQAEVLAQLSQWYASPFWDAVRAWLERVVKEAGERSRAAVAQGLSQLALENWEEVEVSYLQPWSRYELGWAGQETATYLLWLMSREERLASAALRTAVRWSSSQIVGQRWTAANVFSGVLGLRYPTEAVRRLWSITVHGNELAEDSILALAGLFSALVHQRESVEPVLNLLDIRLREYGRTGADQRLQRLTMTAILSVLSVTAAEGSRPAVVALLRDNPDVSSRIARLWAETLRHRPHRLRAMETLADALAALGDDEKYGRATAYRLCADLASALPAHEHPHLNREFAAHQARSRRPEKGSLGDVLRAALAQDIKEESHDAP